MSLWEYNTGRKVCLQNMAAGDFSNGTEPKNAKERKKLIAWAKKELAAQRQTK